MSQDQNKELVNSTLSKLKEFDIKCKELFKELTKDIDKEKIMFDTDDWAINLVTEYVDYKDTWHQPLWITAGFDEKYGKDWLDLVCDIDGEFGLDTDKAEDYVYNTILVEFFTLFDENDFMIFTNELINKTENARETILDQISDNINFHNEAEAEEYKNKELRALIEIALANFDKRSKELFQELAEELGIGLVDDSFNTVSACNFLKSFKPSWSDIPTYEYDGYIESDSKIFKVFKNYDTVELIELLNALILVTANIRDNILAVINRISEELKLHKSA